MNLVPTLSSRAATLAAASKTILPLALAASASAATLHFDFFGSGLYDNSGFFVSSLINRPAVGGGITQGTGFKLYGSDTISDTLFTPGNDGDGLALLWGGAITGSLTAGDILSAPFDFNYAFTHTPSYEGDTNVSTSWKITLGVFEWNGEEPINWTTDSSGGAYNSVIGTADTGGGSDVAGSFTHTGNVGLLVEEWMLESYNPSHWFVRLEMLWDHENGGLSANNDSLTITVPQNSIDLTYSPIPESSSLLLAAAGSAIMFRRRRNP